MCKIKPVVKPKGLADYLREDPSLMEKKTYEKMHGLFCEGNNKPFGEHLKEAISKTKINGIDIMNKIQASYNSLFNKTGVQPNTVMITQDYLSEIIVECLGEYRAINMKPDQLWGMEVIIINGSETVKACIINKEE